MESEYARAGAGHRRDPDAVAVGVSDRLEKVETDLKDTQSKLSEVLPKLVATREQLEHSLVRAPATGQVVGLTVFTVGGVVAPGQKLMDVIPDGRELVIQAQLNPSDADDAYAGQKAQIRFTTVHNRSLPLFTGTVRTVSADSFTDEKTGRSYFRAEIVVPDSETQQGPVGSRPRRASSWLAGRGRADGAQANRARISHRAIKRSAVALGARGLTFALRRESGSDQVNERILDMPIWGDSMLRWRSCR